jgi:NADH oxidase (H2O2-forming)
MAIDNEMEIVIIGLGASGLYASRSAMNQNRKCRVTIIEKRDFDQYSPCGLPYAIEGMVKDFSELKYSVPEVKGRMTKLLSHEVVRIDPAEKKVHVKDLTTGQDKVVVYDSLILSNGTTPQNLPIPGARELVGKGVHFCTDIDDSKAILDAALNSKKRAAVVVGAGANGLEVAYALKVRGLKVTLTKRTEPALPKNLDPDMGKIVTEYLGKEGIRVTFGKGIDRINGTDHVESAVIAGETIDCDMVVMAVGSTPNTALAVSAGCKVSKAGVIVDNRMETTVKGIYATGDLVETFSRIDRSNALMPLATSAFRQGMVAGTNAAGGNASYAGVLNTFVTRIGEIEIASTGYTLEKALLMGFPAKGISTKKEIKPHYIPGNTEISLRVVCDERDGRILGFQAIGHEGAGWRANVFALAIQGGMTLLDIMDAELSYNPPVSQMYDPIYQLAEIALKRLRLEPKAPSEVFFPLRKE